MVLESLSLSVVVVVVISAGGSQSIRFGGAADAEFIAAEFGILTMQICLTVSNFEYRIQFDERSKSCNFNFCFFVFFLFFLPSWMRH
jgi:hypothetical protein